MQGVWGLTLGCLSCSRTLGIVGWGKAPGCKAQAPARPLIYPTPRLTTPVVELLPALLKQ